MTLCIFIFLKVPLSGQEAKSIRLERMGEDTNRGFRLDILVSQKSVMKLNLSKSDKVSSDAPVFVSSSPGSFVQLNKTSLNEFTVYQDLVSEAAFLKFPDQSIQGTFRLDNREFFLQPKAQSRRRKRDLVGDYTATTIEFDQNTKEPDRPPSQFIKITDEMKAYLTDSKAEKLKYVVEVLLFIDHSIYQNWLSLSKNNQEDAINSIRYYYSSVVNSMDLRYNSIKEQDFSISIKLAGFVIGTTGSSSSWTHNYLVRSGDGKQAVDSYRVLDDFPAWLDNNAYKLPKFDNALIFTRLPLRAGNFDDGIPRYISGLANIGAVCNNQAISINKENAPFATTGTASHELAHNLGSLHDTYVKNSCKATDQYIMSPAPGQLTPTTALNPFKFSPCSINYMRQYLGALSLMRKNCLVQTTYNPSLDGIPVNKPVGQFISIDRQCRHLFGSESFYCAGMNFDLKMCSSLLCYDPVARKCTTRAEYRAANGTTCGNRKWCHKGNCIFNDEAPYASDFCMSGDYRGPDFNCKIEIAKDSSRCYDEYYERKCCAMCDFLKRQSSKCPYGDQIPSYCNKISASECYSADTRSRCCETCFGFKTSEASGCEFGNRASWCSGTHSSICYRDSHTCCALCQQNQLPYAGCEYGDRAEWCRNVTTEQCAKVGGECCIQCNPAYKREVDILLKPRTGIAASPPTNKLDCPRDDKWCRRVPAFACYDVKILNECPCRCGKMVVSIADQGCRYGDKETWCRMVKKENCPFVRDPSDCCYSCPIGSLLSSSAHKDLTFSSILAFGLFTAISSTLLNL